MAFEQEHCTGKFSETNYYLPARDSLPAPDGRDSNHLNPMDNYFILFYQLPCSFSGDMPTIFDGCCAAGSPFHIPAFGSHHPPSTTTGSKVANEAIQRQKA